MSHEKHTPDKRWPRTGVDPDRIADYLKERLEGSVQWGTATILGFPSMSPHPAGLAAFADFQARHTNAILCHTRGRGEKGFDGVQDLERAVIHMTADLLGADPDAVDGYITSGGTEANMMGLWIGRQKLRQEIKDHYDTRVAVLASPFSHYSLRKACNLVDVGEGMWLPCEYCAPFVSNPSHACHVFVPAHDGSGLQFVKAHDDGRIDVEALEAKIRSLHDGKGIRRFILFINEGTTLTGAMDDTKSVGALVARLRNEWEYSRFYVHVDAAYGGFIYPFVDPTGMWGLRVPEVDSITADPYKMGQAPLAQGVFICRKNLQGYIERPTGYVHGQSDDTLIGSRSGAHAAAIYAVIMTEGYEGFARMHRDSVAMADSLHAALSRIPGLRLLPRMLNMVSFMLPETLSLPQLAEIDQRVIRPFYVMSDTINIDPENLDSHPRRLVKCNITRDAKPEWLAAFVDALGTLLVR